MYYLYDEGRQFKQVLEGNSNVSVSFMVYVNKMGLNAIWLS